MSSNNTVGSMASKMTKMRAAAATSKHKKDQQWMEKSPHWMKLLQAEKNGNLLQHALLQLVDPFAEQFALIPVPDTIDAAAFDFTDVPGLFLVPENAPPPAPFKVNIRNTAESRKRVHSL